MPGDHKKKNKQKKAHHNGEPHDHPHKKKEDLKKRLAKIGADNKRGDVDVDKNEQYKSIGSNEYYNKHDADVVDYDKDILDKVQLKNKKKVKKAELSSVVKEQKKKKGKEKLIHQAGKRKTKRKDIEVDQETDSVYHKGFDITNREGDSAKGRMYGPNAKPISDKTIDVGNKILQRTRKASKGVDTYSSQDPKNSKVKKKHIKGKVSKQLIALRKKVNKIKNNPPQGPSGGTADTPESIIKDAEAVAKTPSYIAKDHDHAISFKGYKGESYKRASLISNTGKYAKYWLLNAKQTNGNGWGVSQQSIAKNIHKFVGKPLVVTAKSWIPNSEYGDAYEHPYLPTNDINKVFDHQEKFRVGSIVDIIEKDGDYYANIEINQKFAHMVMPPFCSPAIFQNNPSEPEGQISDWEALHLAALHEDPAYGSRIALLRGTCVGTQDQCTVQFKAAKQEAKMVCTKGLKGRIATLKKNENLKQRLAAIKDFGENNVNKHFTAPINKKNELGETLRRKRIKETQPHIGGGEPYKRKGRVIDRSPPSMDHYYSYPQERTKPGTMEEEYQPSYPPPKPFARPNVKERDRKPGTLFDNEGGLQDREFAADSFDDQSMKDPDKWSGEDLKKLEEELTPPSLSNYTRKQPLQDRIHQLNPGSVTKNSPDWEAYQKQKREEAKYIKDPNYKIKPIEPTRMEWRAIISAKLKQRIAGIQQTAFAGPPKDVIAAFREKKPLKFREKVKGRNKEYAFQTDGKTLYQSGFPIAQHTKKGIKFSYQSHPSATTAQAGRMLGINTFTKKGKTYVNGKEIDPNTDDYIEVPTKDIQEGTFKVNPNSTPAITEDKVKRNRDQEYFRSKSEKEALAGNQDLVVQTHKKKEVLDHGSITPEEQARINKITGLRNRAKRVYATDYHHSLPAEKGGGIGGGIFNRRVTSGAVPLSKKTHQEAHFPEKTIPKSFYSKLKQRLGVIGMPEPFEDRYETVKNTKSNLSSFKIEDPEMDYILGKTDKIKPKKQGLDRLVKNRWAKLKQRTATLNMPKGGITGMEKHTTDFNNLKKQTKDMEGYTIHDGKLLDFNNQEHVNEFASAYPGKKGEHLYMVANTQNVRSIKDKILGTMQKDWENQGHPNTVLGGWKGQIDLNAVFRAKDSKQALEYAKKYNQEAITEINSVANTVNFIDNPSYKPKTQ